MLVVTDEEDCSIENPGIFETPEWLSGPTVDPAVPGTGHLNTACNSPESNETDNLYDPESYFDRLIELKSGVAGAVVFAAIAGVPMNDDCQGSGDQIGNCLDAPEMKLVEQLHDYPNNPGQYYHFTPA